MVDTGAQISVVRKDLLVTGSGEDEGIIQFISALGEKEIAALRIFDMKIDDDMHSFVPITCAVSKRLVSDMLICATSYELLLENIQLSNLKFQENFDDSEDKGVSEMSEEQLSVLNLTQEIETDESEPTFSELQRRDESLKPIWDQAQKKLNSYEIDGGILMHTESVCGENVKQVVLPVCKREKVLKFAHEIPLAWH